MSASSAASSSLTRDRTSVWIVGGLATLAVVYYTHQVLWSQSATHQGSAGGLHRSNAVHGRQRRERRPPPSLQNEGIGSTSETDSARENSAAPFVTAHTLTDGETIVDDQANADDYPWQEAPAEQSLGGHNLVQLLFRVSEDATRRNAYVHRGCQCNSCGVVPIRGIRYRCANCADYDLCESCEALAIHTKTHIFYKVRVPAPSFGPRQMHPVWYTGDPDSAVGMLPKELIKRLSAETGFERPELDAYWEQWTFMANTEWRDDPDDINLAMDRKTFERCLVPAGYYKHAPPSLIFDRMFAFYDTNQDGYISFVEFLHGLAYRRKKDKWRRIFEGYDIDGDGYVDRKDFIRLFRSYYVLYKQMHTDMLEGLDEQQRSSTDAYRLINGRQPLSSAFGQDGHYPHAPEPRAGEGKIALANGDLEIIDGKGIISENKDDTANREEVFKRRVPSRTFDYSTSHRDTDYWHTMIEPPVTIDQMADVLGRLENGNRRMDAGYQENSHPALVLGVTNRIDHETHDSPDGEDLAHDSTEMVSNWPPQTPVIIDEDAEAVQGPGTRVADVHRGNQQEVIEVAIQRERTRRDIHERWQRRQFYTDEEEGAVPPDDWNEEEDILLPVGTNGESSKAASRPSIHSRSSSKVRFAEELDDLDTRSNPSTSSRSVPERWGGMEIPDAEKDAGKEILYQTTQQAFNELLDPLFKPLEDMAVEAAKTRKERKMYGVYFDRSEFKQWLQERDKNKSRMQSPTVSGRHHNGSKVTQNPVWPGFAEVEVDQVRERPLEDLLAATGYEVGPPIELETPTEMINDLELAPDSAFQQIINRQAENNSPEADPSAADYGSSQAPIPRNTITPAINNAMNEPPRAHQSSSEAFETRDPTLPQFRPNATIDTFVDQTREAESVHEPHLAESGLENGLDLDEDSPDEARESSPWLTESQGKGRFDGFEFGNPEKLDDCSETAKSYLLYLWDVEQAEKQMEIRGGWGKLGCDEFQALIKKFTAEGKGNQMDYLGSWVEFCIP